MAKLFREDKPQTVFTKRRVIFSILGLLIVAGGVTAYMLISKIYSEQAKTAFTVDGKVYTKNEVTSLIKYSTQRGVNKEVASKNAFEYLKRQATAKKVGIQVSNTQIAAAKDFLFPKSKTAYDIDGAPWIELASYNEALTRTFIANKVTDASGYVFVFQFDQLMMSDFVTNPPAGYGDATLIAKDRAYAQGRANYYHDALKAGKLSSEVALKEIKADIRLGQLNITNTNTSVRFVGFVSGDPTRPEVYIGGDAKDEVINLSNKKSIGDVKVGRTVKIEGVPKTDADYQEAYYYFVLIDKPAGSAQSTKSSFDAALKALSASYKGLN